MDYAKLDAPLGAALSEEGTAQDSLLSVFIHAKRKLNHDEAAELEQLGVELGERPKRIITATIPAGLVEKLSEKPWVRSIKLSQKLRPLDQDDH